MNKLFTFIDVQKGCLPAIVGTMLAKNVYDAIRSMDYWPWCLSDYQEEHELRGTEFLDWEFKVFRYYGLDGGDSWEEGNGADGCHRMVVETDGTVNVKMYPSENGGDD